MTITYSLAPEPFWYISNLVGEAAGGAKMYTRRALNHDENKVVYQDAAGSLAWTNPIIFDLNGVQGPFYWEFDSNDPDELYYIYVTDAEDNLIWDINGFSGGNGGGGGGTVTTFIPLTNYIANNQFIDHIADTVTTSLTNLVIAPSNHKGFTPAAVSPATQTNGVVGPDIRFLKNSTANTDNVTFPLFNLASSPLSPDVTPVDYVHYQCTTSNPGEVYKCFQFPITQKIKNLSNQVMTFKIWAAVAATPVNITAYLRQYFGSGTAASAEVRTAIATIPLTTTWTQLFYQFTVPSVAAKSIGTVGSQTDDDALYIQLEMPLNAACDVYFTKPALYLGDIQPPVDYEDYDQIDSINSTARTGDIKIGYLPTAPLGWLTMNDGSIGNVGSGATNLASASAFQLYSTIYTAVSDTWAPVSTGRTAPGNTMAAAITDFIANKTLTLPRALGRAFAGAGTGSGLSARAVGQYTGVETYQLVANDLPPHVHPPLAPNSAFKGEQGGAGRATSGSGDVTSMATTGANTTTNQAVSLMQPTSFMNVYIKT